MDEKMSMAKERWELIQEPLQYFFAGLGLLALTFGVLTVFFHVSELLALSTNATFAVSAILCFPAAAGLFFGVCFTLMGGCETLYSLFTGRSLC
jgi:hypothetical protein